MPTHKMADAHSAAHAPKTAAARNAERDRAEADELNRLTKVALMKLAAGKNVAGRSRMNKEELVEALERDDAPAKKAAARR